jgi:hypothetical protein
MVDLMNCLHMSVSVIYCREAPLALLTVLISTFELASVASGMLSDSAVSHLHYLQDDEKHLLEI